MYIRYKAEFNKYLQKIDCRLVLLAKTPFSSTAVAAAARLPTSAWSMIMQIYIYTCHITSYIHLILLFWLRMYIIQIYEHSVISA